MFSIIFSWGVLLISVLECFYSQGHLADGKVNDVTFIFTQFRDHIRKINPHKTIIDVVMFDGDSDLNIGGETLKNNYPKLTVTRGV